MAKRSDFAQKLLDDLRLRKERMVASQNSCESKPMLIDAYAYSKQAHRGSRDMKTADISSRNANLLSRSSRAEGVSNQMVPYGRGQQQRQIGDVSRALVFAIENRGKVRRTESSHHSNPILGLLQQIGTGIMNFVKIDGRSSLDRQGPSSSHVSALSHFQIQEISKGASRINQILRACSTGPNISIEIGKELLQGAIDLEQSLRMLANLQDASGYKMSPKCKPKITLLEEDNDDDGNDTDKIRHNQVDLPKFSFDKKSRHSQVFRDIGKTDVKQKRMALTYTAEGRGSNKEKKDIAKLNSKRPSASYGSDVRSVAATLEETNQLLLSKPKPEKGRISNVIAKLMGLDDPQEIEDMNHCDQKDSNSKSNEGITVKQTDIRSHKSIGTITEPRIMDATNTTMEFFQEEKRFAQENRSLEIVKQSWKELGSIKVMKVPEKTCMRMDMPRYSDSGKYNYLKDGKDDPLNPKAKKQTRIYKKELVSSKRLTQMELQKLERSEGKTSLHKGKDSSRDIGVAAKRCLNEHVLTHRKPHSQRGIQSSARQKLQVRSQRGGAIEPMKKPTSITSIPAESVDAMEPKKDEDFPQLKVGMKETTKRKSDEVPYQSQSHGIVQVAEENHVSPLLVKKVENTKIQYNDIPRKVTDDVTGKSSISHQPKPAKHEGFVVQGAKHGGYGKLNVHRVVHAVKEPKTQANIISAAKAEPLNVTEPQKKEAKQPPTSYTSDEFRAKEGHLAAVRVETCAKKIFTPNHDHQDPFNAEEDLMANTATEEATDGTHEEDTQIALCKQQADQNILGLTDSITESEKRLNRILIRSQTFLNTAEALFKLKIPFDILNNRGQGIHDESGKLLLDCGYEVMKRKGMSQEIAVHPFMKLSITGTSIKTMNGLIQQIHRDIEKLEHYGRSATITCYVQDYLPKMLQYDVYNKYSDLNCMWDLGWKDTNFAVVERFDIIRDVEKNVLNGILDEMVRDLLICTLKVDRIVKSDLLYVKTRERNISLY